MSAPALTVIMSCYNQAEFLRQAIESVLMQKTDFPVKLLISDDHFTKDDSRALVADYDSAGGGLGGHFIRGEAGEFHLRRDTLTKAQTSLVHPCRLRLLRVRGYAETEFWKIIDSHDIGGRVPLVMHEGA